MPDAISKIIGSFCTIYQYERAEQQSIFQQFIDLCRNTPNYVSDEQVFTGLNSIKLYFYTQMEKSEHSDYIDCCLNYIHKRKEFYYQLFETISVIYKGLEATLQNMIFDEFLDCYEELLKTNRGVTTISIFIKNTHKVYSSMQSAILNELMVLLERRCKDELRDTYEYCFINTKRLFIGKTNKILLLIPEFQTATSFVQPPLCMLSVGTQLQNAGIPFDLLDNRVFSYSIEQLVEIARQYDIIATTSSPLDQVQTYFLDYRYSLFVKTVNLLQARLDGNQKIIVCGAHSSVRCDIVCKDIKPDYILRGEYDIQLFKLIRRILEGKSLDSFNNLLIRDKGIYKTNSENSDDAHPKEWERLMIDYSLVSPRDYFGYHYIGNTHVKRLKHAVVQATRGCPFHCIFCYNFYTHSVRYKNIDVLIHEIETIAKVGFEEFFFIDQTFTINVSFIQELCRRMIESGVRLKWTCETRIELIDEKTIRLMKEAGCVGIWFGVESFDETVLDINKKGYVKSDYNRTIALLKQYNIDYRAFIMLGMKGDTQESLDKTIDTIVNNRIHISKTIVRCKVRFGTELFEGLPESQKKGLNSFEGLGLYKENLSTLSSEELSIAEQRLMVLNRT